MGNYITYTLIISMEINWLCRALRAEVGWFSLLLSLYAYMV